MDLKLKGKVAVVTGGSKGIGKSIALALAKEGVKLVLCARGSVALKAAEKEILALGGQVKIVSANVSKAKEVQKVISVATKTFGRLDILINNAGGVNTFGRFEEISDKDWLESYQTNVMSIVYFVRLALPALKKSSAPRIINISSISGLEPGFYNPHYTVNKAAVLNLSKILANQLAKEKVLVNSVCVGPVHSALWDKNVQGIAKMRKQSVVATRKQLETDESAKIPLGRIGEGEDVAGLVVYLSSAQSAWVTGSCFQVDGGKNRSIG